MLLREFESIREEVECYLLEPLEVQAYKQLVILSFWEPFEHGFDVD